MATAATSETMTASELVTALRAAGVVLRLDKATVHYRTRGEVAYDLLAELGRRGGEVRTALEDEGRGD
jgi:hypothetical protein